MTDSTNEMDLSSYDKRTLLAIIDTLTEKISLNEAEMKAGDKDVTQEGLDWKISMREKAVAAVNALT